MFKKWKWFVVAAILILAIGFGAYALVNYFSGKTKPVASEPTLPFVKDLDELRSKFKQKKYEAVASSSKGLYDNESNSIDFRLAALGYCVRALKVLGKDTSTCQNKANSLMEGTENPYKQFLQDSFDDKEVATQ